MQNTVKSAISFAGKGLHSGKPATATVLPAAPNFGIWFKRTDVGLGDRMIPARWDAVNRSPLCTKLENKSGLQISTVEHLMAALAGCGIHNAMIEIDGPEVPILDGSAAPFVRGIMARGVQMQAAPVMAFEVLKEVTVRDGDAVATIAPSDTLRIDFEIEFAAPGFSKKDFNYALKLEEDENWSPRKKLNAGPHFLRDGFESPEAKNDIWSVIKESNRL